MSGAYAVPLTDIEVTEDDVAAVMAVYESGWLTMGPRTQELEAGLARFCDVPSAVAVSSGSAALHLACRAAGIGPGDEVIVPSFTFLATAHAVRWCGADVVLADSTAGPDHGAPDSGATTDVNVSVADVERRITPRTRAVIAVHMFGLPADVVGLRAVCDRHGLVLIEDMAQAMGAHYPDGRPCGSAGDLACLSMFSKKQLCVGEGGAVLTGSAERAATVRSLRSHAMTSGTWDRHSGHEESYDVVDLGHNYRIDEPRAALGLARLPRLAADVAARRLVVRWYRERLADVDGLTFVGDAATVERSSHLAVPVVTASHEARIALRDGLAARGVQTTRYPALHTLTAYASADPSVAASLATAAALADRHVCLPIWSHLGEDVVDRVCTATADVMSGRS